MKNHTWRNKKHYPAFGEALSLDAVEDLKTDDYAPALLERKLYDESLQNRDM